MLLLLLNESSNNGTEIIWAHQTVSMLPYTSQFPLMLVRTNGPSAYLSPWAVAVKSWCVSSLALPAIVTLKAPCWDGSITWWRDPGSLSHRLEENSCLATWNFIVKTCQTFSYEGTDILRILCVVAYFNYPNTPSDWGTYALSFKSNHISSTWSPCS